MTNNQNQPREFDPGIGGETPPPLQGVVLGGVEGVKRRLSSANIEIQIVALNEALNYGNQGLDVIINALEHNSIKVQKAAAKLLKSINNKQSKLALDKYKFWKQFEKYYDFNFTYVSKFANRKVIEFDHEIGIHDTLNTAYALRVIPHDKYYSKYVMNSVEKLQILSQSSLANQIEALVFGFWYTNSLEDYTFRPIVDTLFNTHQQMTKIEALFIGDVNYSEWGYLPLIYSDLSYILLAYPQLEILKIRCNSSSRYYNCFIGLEFSPVQHDNLKAIIIESSGIYYEVIEEIFKLELPVLEYLELWLGTRYEHTHYEPNELILLIL